MHNSGGTKVSFNWVRLFRFYMRSCNSFNLWARSGILNFLCYTSSLLRRSLNDKSETTSASAGRTHQKLSNEPRYRSPFIGDLTRGTF